MATSLRYPANRDTGNGSKFPFVQFEFFEFDQGVRKPQGTTISLFMPPSFQITDGQEYEFKEKGIISKTVGAGVEGTKDTVLIGLAEKTGLGSDFSERAAGLGGAIRDPKFFNYKEPRPREFSFNYKFEPKSAADGSAMMEIIRRFRAASYPRALPGGRVYGVPLSVKITVKPESILGIEGSLGSFWVIKELSTTLSEGDQFLTVGSGDKTYPNQVSFQIQLQETVLLQRSDGLNLLGSGETDAVE